jgi:hypothetical protein
MAKLNARIMWKIVAGSAARGNGAAGLTSYAARMFRVTSLRTTVACHTLTIVSALGLVITGAVGCVDRNTEALEEIRSKMCACESASCAEQELSRVPQATIKSTPHTQEIARGMLGCLAKLQEAERPTTDPDSPGAEAPAAPSAGSGTPR